MNATPEPPPTDPRLRGARLAERRFREPEAAGSIPVTQTIDEVLHGDNTWIFRAFGVPERVLRDTTGSNLAHTLAICAAGQRRLDAFHRRWRPTR